MSGRGFIKSRSDCTLLTVDAIYGQTSITLLAESRKGRYFNGDEGCFVEKSGEKSGSVILPKTVYHDAGK